MSSDLAIHAVLGLLPVVCFLAVLVWLDSYKLVRVRLVLGTIALGCAVAALSYPINSAGLQFIQIGFVPYTRYVAPLIEESLKAIIVVMLVRHNRIGFLVDAAILGFAVGAGFAILENLFYLQLIPETRLGTWIVRGFGTALMHGGATAIFAVVSHALVGQKMTLGVVSFLPGFVVASVTHSVFNHFFFTPIINTLTVLIALPLLLVLVFQKSERSVADWLGSGFDADIELLHIINSGEFSSSKIGLYLHSLKEKFEGTVVVDILCYLRLHIELSIRAKGLMMMRESGFMNKAGEETKAKLEEMKYLEKSIGPTGKLAIKPFIKMSREDLWQFYMLSD